MRGIGSCPQRQCEILSSLAYVFQDFFKDVSVPQFCQINGLRRVEVVTRVGEVVRSNSLADACSDKSDGEFIPMIWGHEGREQDLTSIRGFIQEFMDRGDQHVLNFNEPDSYTRPGGHGIAMGPFTANPHRVVVR